MRKLTRKQKNILDEYKHINSIEKLPYDVWEQLVEIHNTEILYQNTDGIYGKIFIQGRG